jgi:putative DNA primase/helicase
VTAPTAGTGKSYLWDIAAAIAVGDAMPIMAAGPNMEELEKRLNSQVIEGLGLWSIDNVSMPVGGDALCQLIERPTYKPRILGKSEMKERRNSWCLFASGNNLRLRDDITRRTLLVQMDARMERPELRQFKGNPFGMVLTDRGRYIWAALTVVLAYRASGCLGSVTRSQNGPTAFARRWFGSAATTRF